MMYLIVYLLDFYPSLINILSFCLQFLIFMFIVQFIVRALCQYEYEEYLEKKSYSYRNCYNIYKTVHSFPVKIRYIVSLVIISLILPSTKGLYILTGLYVGEQAITNIQANPLYEKAYKLAEIKLDDLLNEANLKLPKEVKK